MATEIKVYTGDTLDCKAGKAHMRRLVKAVRENNALSRGRTKANRTGEYAHQKRWQDWIALTCPEVPREEYAGEGGRAKRMALLAEAGDEPSQRAMARAGKPRKARAKAEPKAPKSGSIAIG